MNASLRTTAGILSACKISPDFPGGVYRVGDVQIAGEATGTNQ
jgi:hypothetical protein